MKHFNIHISGRVQGVFFRDSTRKKAMELGIKGFVRNQQDGSVYVEAEGDEETLKEFMDWCRHGPPQAEVDKIDAVPAPVIGYKEFEIRY